MEHLQRYEEEQMSQLRYWSPAPARADVAHPDSLAADVDDLLEVAAAIRQVDSDKSLTSQVSDTGSQRLRLTQQHQPKHVGHVAEATASEAARSGMDEERNTGSSERGGAVGQGNWGEGVVVHAGKSMGGAVGAAAATAAATEAAAALIRPRGLYAVGQSGRSLGGGRRQARRGVEDKLGEAATTGAHEVEGRWGSEGGYVTRREMHAVLAGMAQLQHTVDVLLLSALVALVHALWSTCKWGVGLVWPLCLLLPLMHRMEHHCRLHCQIWTGAGDGMDRE
ncbi:unnamed protein product [Closterium sp. NIES-64]|nr:unnamed protein product [Closterium sp. NIES-64]